MLSPPRQSDSRSSTRDSLSCTQCDRRFSRPSHLNRHRLTHLPPSRRNTISCPSCDQFFSRRDVLLRHLRSTHAIDVPASNSYQKSCHHCVRRKLKCDRSIPCQSCVNASIADSCSYPAIDGALGPLTQVLDHSPANIGLPRQPYQQSASPDSLAGSSPQPPQSVHEFSEGNVEAFSDLNPPFEPLLLEAEGFNPGCPSGDPALDGRSAIFGLSPGNDGPLDFRYTGFDWLDFDVVSDGELGLDFNDVAVPFPTAPTVLVPPPNGPIPHSPSMPQARQPGLPWPFEQGQEAAPARYPLPSLRDVLHHSFQPSPGTQTSTIEGLVQVLSEPRLPRIEDTTDSSASLGIGLLKQLLDVYFSSFQLIQPILHAPTFQMAECPTMLLASMACIGAVGSNEPNALELSGHLSDLCAPMITWLGVSDSAHYSNVSYLVSLCLHQIYSLGSGNRQLYQNADRTRGVLIGSLRGLGLLSSRPSLQQEAENSRSSATDAANIHAEWYFWISREREVRLAWASFEYDCSLCTLTSRRGAVDLSELPSKLPSADCLWDAPTATSWAALKSRLPQSALGPSLSSVLGAAISCSPYPRHVSAWGKRLCSQVIGRLLWDLKQLEIISTTDCFSLPALAAGQQQSKASLLKGLDCLLETMNEPISTAELVSYNISSLLCHYSHLYTADDIMDLILYIVRNVASRGSSHDKSVDLARKRLISALKKDPRRARKLVWHAGQIIGVTNEYLVSAPCEIMRLFMSFIFIIAFIKFYPHQPSHSGQAGDDFVRLDSASKQSDHIDAVAGWVGEGGPARIGSAHNIFSPGSSKAILQDAQTMLQQLRAWGLAEKFVKILQRFENSELN